MILYDAASACLNTSGIAGRFSRVLISCSPGPPGPPVGSVVVGVVKRAALEVVHLAVHVVASAGTELPPVVRGDAVADALCAVEAPDLAGRRADRDLTVRDLRERFAVQRLRAEVRDLD